MKEKANSQTGGEDGIPRTDPDTPGLPAGEELIIDPVAGDEIDPIRKWWDEAEETNREKTRNRRLEELAAEGGTETPLDARERALVRRRKQTEPPADEAVGEADETDATPTEETASPTVPDLSAIPPSSEDEAAVPAEAEAEENPPLDLEKLFSPPVEFPDPLPGLADCEEKTRLSEEDEPPLAPPVEDTEEEQSLPSVPVVPEIASPDAPAEMTEMAAQEFPEAPAAEPQDTPGSAEESEPIAEEKTAAETVAEPPEDSAGEPETKQLLTTEEKEAAAEDDKAEETAVGHEETPSEEASEAPLASAAGDTEPSDDPAPQETDDEESDSAAAPAPPAEAEIAPSSEPASPAPGELPPVRKKAGCWTVFATFFFFASLLLVAALGAVGWFAWSRLGDLEDEVAARVRSNLEEKGIHLDYGSGSYQFPRGLIFDEVTIFDDETKQRPLLKVDGLGVNLDLAGLLRDRGEFRSGGFTLRDSTLTFFEKGEPVTTLEKVEGDILTGPEGIRVDRISALSGGWRVHLDGLVSLSAARARESFAVGTPAHPPATLSAPDFSLLKQLKTLLAVGSDDEEAPVLHLRFAMDASPSGSTSVEGRVYGRDITWEGIGFSSAMATFQLVPETGEWRVPGFQIGYGEGFIGGSFTVDPASRRLRLEQIRSSVDVLALLAQYKPEWAENWKTIRLTDMPSLRISGEVPWEDPASADLRVRYDHREGLVVALEKGELPLSDLRGTFTVNRGTVETNDVGLELFGGAVRVNGAMRLTDEARPFNGLVEITGLSLDKAASFFGKEDTGMSGRLSFVFRGVGYREIEKMRGGGVLRIEEAILPGLPVLGEIQEYVGRAVPAFGVKGEGTITGAYIVESGVLVASDLTVSNSAARIVTSGSLNLRSLETNFKTKAELVPALAAATGLTDKAITFEGGGPVRDADITLQHFPLEFASVSLGSILGTSPHSLGTLKAVPGIETAVETFADQLDQPGVTIHPEVMGVFKTLLGEEVSPPTEPAAEPVAEPASEPEKPAATPPATSPPATSPPATSPPVAIPIE